MLNKDKLIAELKNQYPDKEIFFDPPESDTPHEIIVEIEPASDHPEHSLAMAVVGKSTPHYHKKTTEVYQAVKGELTITIDGVVHKLQPGEKITIEPGQVHSAEGNEAWFLTHSTPGWTFEDHVVFDKNPSINSFSSYLVCKEHVDAVKSFLSDFYPETVNQHNHSAWVTFCIPGTGFTFNLMKGGDDQEMTKNLVFELAVDSMDKLKEFAEKYDTEVKSFVVTETKTPYTYNYVDIVGPQGICKVEVHFIHDA